MRVLDVLYDLMLERIGAQGDHVQLVPEADASLLPRPCPLFGERMPPAVFSVSDEEHREFLARVVSRYLRSLTLGTRRALQVAARDEGPPLDDAELGRIVWQTSFSRLLVPTLDPIDHARFADVLRESSGETIYKLDFTHLGHQTPFEGVSLAPTVALFTLRGQRLVPRCIAVGEYVSVPADGEAWARARLFLLQGCSLSLVDGIHASLHFPMDSVIAVTRALLPEAHPVFRLVESHAYLQLPLDHGVRWNERSVAWNNPREIYTPFPIPGKDVFRGFSDYYAGIEGNSAYAGFTYPMGPPSFPGPYCAFLGAYYDVVFEFSRHVAAHCALRAPELRAWAAALHELLPGFPSADALAQPDVLARALAGFVHAVSIWHSTEPHLYAALPVRKAPQRLRVPPPTGPDDPSIPADEWMCASDLFRQEMARQMFYEPHPVRSMLDVRYGFAQPTLEAEVRPFFEALRACDRAQPQRFMPLARMACSIQF